MTFLRHLHTRVLVNLKSDSGRCRYIQAVRFFSNLSQSDVHFAMPMARALAAIGDMEQASMAMQKAIQSLPDNLEMHLAYAELLLKEERCEEALNLAKRAVQLVPGSTGAWMLLSKVYVQAGAFDLAMIALNVTPAAEEPPLPLLGIPKTAAGKTSPPMRHGTADGIVDEEEDGPDVSDA